MTGVRVAVRGESGINIERIYNFADLDVPASLVRDAIESGRKININDAIILFVECATRMAQGGADAGEIEDEITGMLTQDTVMIGVAEMMREVSLEVIADHRTIQVRASDPLGRTRSGSP